MTAPVLRPYQDAAVADFERAVAAGHRRILLVAPTASGKTVVFCAIIKQYVEQYKTVLVISHRREIITQTSAKLTANGIYHGIIQAGIDPRPMARVQVASIATLHVRAVRNKIMSLPPAVLLIIDEAHHAPATTYRRLVEAYPDAVILGATATPCRGDGRGLGGIFEMIIECPQIPELIEGKWLVPTRVYAPVDPDLRGVRTVAGDRSVHRARHNDGSMAVRRARAAGHDADSRIPRRAICRVLRAKPGGDPSGPQGSGLY